MSEKLQIIDAENQPIALDAQIDGGNGIVGRAVAILPDGDDEGGGPQIDVEWPEWPGAPERFSCSPRNYRAEGPSGPYVWKCAEVAVVDG